MRPLDTSSRHEWMNARVEAYVDGDLSASEGATFEQVLAESPHWQAQVRYARRIHEELHTLPHPVCPPQVTDAVLAETRRRAQGTPRVRWKTRWWRRLDMEWQAGWKPALATLTLVLLIVASALLSTSDTPAHLFRQQSTLPHAYTQTEIQQAETKAKWALAYIAQVSERTGSTVEETVLEENVAAPMRRALRPLADVDAPPTNP